LGFPNKRSQHRFVDDILRLGKVKGQFSNPLILSLFPYYQGLPIIVKADQ
jgi:hypothetical protein